MTGLNKLCDNLYLLSCTMYLKSNKCIPTFLLLYTLHILAKYLLCGSVYFTNEKTAPFSQM